MIFCRHASSTAGQFRFSYDPVVSSQFYSNIDNVGYKITTTSVIVSGTNVKTTLDSNMASIATNTANSATTTANITARQAVNTTLTSNISFNTTNITTNITNITTNTANIATNTADVTEIFQVQQKR